MTAGVTYERYDGEEAARPQLDAFLPVYEEVYADPPYSEGPSDVAAFIESYIVHARRRGMRLVLARDGDEIVGFTYGYLLPADTGWWSSVRDPLPEEFVREDGERTWVIFELAVRKPWRRRGIAAGLHAALLDGLTEERVTLTVRPEADAAPARAAYAAWGYRRVGLSHPWPEARSTTRWSFSYSGPPHSQPFGKTPGSVSDLAPIVEGMPTPNGLTATCHLLLPGSTGRSAGSGTRAWTRSSAPSGTGSSWSGGRPLPSRSRSLRAPHVLSLRTPRVRTGSVQVAGRVLPAATALSSRWSTREPEDGATSG